MAENKPTMNIHAKAYIQNLELSVSKEVKSLKVKLFQSSHQQDRLYLKAKIHTLNQVLDFLHGTNTSDDKDARKMRDEIISLKMRLKEALTQQARSNEVQKVSQKMVRDLKIRVEDNCIRKLFAEREAQLKREMNADLCHQVNEIQEKSATRIFNMQNLMNENQDNAINNILQLQHKMEVDRAHATTRILDLQREMKDIQQNAASRILDLQREIEEIQQNAATKILDVQHDMENLQETAESRMSLECARNKALTFKLEEALKLAQEIPSQACCHQSEDKSQLENPTEEQENFISSPLPTELQHEGEKTEDSVQVTSTCMNPCEQDPVKMKEAQMSQCQTSKEQSNAEQEEERLSLPVQSTEKDIQENAASILSLKCTPHNVLTSKLEEALKLLQQPLSQEADISKLPTVKAVDQEGKTDLQNSDEEGTERLQQQEEKPKKRKKKKRNWFVRLFTCCFRPAEDN